MKYALLPLPLLILAACPGEKSTDDEGIERIDLGTFTTDTGFGADVPVDVPEGAVSSIVACGPYGTDTLATAETITAPDASVVYDMNDPEATAFRIGVQDDFLPMLLPVSPDLDLTTGAYTYRVYVDTTEAATISCQALFRTEPPSGDPTVNLHLIFVGVEAATGLNATSAHDDAALTAALDEVTSLWAGAGITVGTISYEDFGGDVDTYSSVDGDAEYSQLLKTANTDDARLIPIFFVNAITDSDGATILGQAAGPPGAAGMGGNAKSGAVVTVIPLVDGDTALMGRLLAHELFHFMGLFHPTSKDGAETDPLSDTPTCPLSADADANGTLSTDECAGTGAENLMWWAASDTSTDVSGDQGWVVTRSPVAL